MFISAHDTEYHSIYRQKAAPGALSAIRVLVLIVRSRKAEDCALLEPLQT